MGVDTSVDPNVTAASGSTSAPVSIPPPLAVNPSGVDDQIVLIANYGNAEQADPTHNGAGTWTDLGDLYDGAGSWGSNAGPRGIKAWTYVTDGSEPAGTFAVTNKELASNVATLTAAGHTFDVGDSVIVTGVDSTFDGVRTVTAVTSSTFSYARTASNVASQSATGTAAGVIVVTNNGATGAGKVIRAVAARFARDPDSSTGWAAAVARFDQDTTLDTSLAIIAATDPGGVSGDVLIGAYCGVPAENNHTGGNSGALSWPGAASGASKILNTSSSSSGNKLRANSYWAPVSGASIGVPRLDLTLGSTVSPAGGAGVGVLIRLRTVGTPPIADCGGNQTAGEPGMPSTLDGTASRGNIATYTWEKESSLGSGSWSPVAGSGAVRTVTNTATVAGTTDSYRLKVTDVSAVESAWDYLTIQVDGTTETFIDASGTERALIIEAVT